MTTPADWRSMVTQLRDREAMQFAKRVVQFQREWLDSMLGQLDETLKILNEAETKLGGGQSKV